MTRAEFDAWLVEADASMRAAQKVDRHRITASQMREHDPQLARLYHRWADAQLAIEEHVAARVTRAR